MPEHCRLFQIYESDLAELERLLPQLMESPNLTPRMRVQWRRVQQIVLNIRWNYGPPEDVEVIPCDGGGDA